MNTHRFFSCYFYHYIRLNKWTFHTLILTRANSKLFILEKSINDACIKEEECRTTLHCARSVCQCASSDYWTGSTCSISILLLYFAFTQSNNLLYSFCNFLSSNM